MANQNERTSWTALSLGVSHPVNVAEILLGLDKATVSLGCEPVANPDTTDILGAEE